MKKLVLIAMVLCAQLYAHNELEGLVIKSDVRGLKDAAMSTTITDVEREQLLELSNDVINKRRVMLKTFIDAHRVFEQFYVTFYKSLEGRFEDNINQDPSILRKLLAPAGVMLGSAAVAGFVSGTADGSQLSPLARVTGGLAVLTMMGASCNLIYRAIKGIIQERYNRERAYTDAMKAKQVIYEIPSASSTATPSVQIAA